MRLLVVDDAADARFLIRVILQDAVGLEIAGEADGATSALAQLEAVEPDVIVLDAMMPRMTGYELAPRLRELRPGVPLVLLTAHVDEVVRRQAEEAGVDEVLGKDQLDRLAEVVLAVAARGA